MSLITALFKKAATAGSSYTKQSQPGGDGLACVASILNTNDVPVTLPELELKYPEYKQGINLKQIMDIFAAHNLKTRALQCPTKDLDKLNMPSLLHWDMKQFVVLISANENSFAIFDPATKHRTFRRDELDHHYGEIALEIVKAD